MFQSLPVAMPRKAAREKAAARPSCDINDIHREWKEQAAVRHVAINTDRLFESSMNTPGLEKKSVKFCIKDAVHNQHVMAPLLYRMARDPTHPLPTLSNVARESLVYKCYDSFLSLCEFKPCVFQLAEPIGLPRHGPTKTKFILALVDLEVGNPRNANMSLIVKLISCIHVLYHLDLILGSKCFG